MPRSTVLNSFLAALFMAGLAAACGGESVGESAGSGKDSGTDATDGGTRCVDLEVVASDLTCGSDSDCEVVRTGEVCSGQCSCGDSPVNAAAVARFQSATASLTLEACPCAFEGEARCLGGQCTLCGFGPDQPAGCGDAGTTAMDAMQIADCVDATVGASCTPGNSTPCSQPANPCETGYIWNCDNNSNLWIHELIQCVTQPNGTTTTTAACGKGEVLFVNDAAGDLCLRPISTGQGADVGAAECPSGMYLFEPNCCYSPTIAYCVPTPAACSQGLTCPCASELCTSQCGGSGIPSGVMCTNAGNSVVDCLCGKL